jgi:hypothetical protein
MSAEEIMLILSRSLESEKVLGTFERIVDGTCSHQVNLCTIILLGLY